MLIFLTIKIQYINKNITTYYSYYCLIIVISFFPQRNDYYVLTQMFVPQTNSPNLTFVINVSPLYTLIWLSQQSKHWVHNYYSIIEPIFELHFEKITTNKHNSILNITSGVLEHKWRASLKLHYC